MIKAKEIKQLSLLLKKIDNPHGGLPQPVFDALSKVVPFVACELVVVDKQGLLMTWREDKWWKGWHFPGGLMRYGESFDERIKKVAWGELGIRLKNYKFLFPINYIKCPRGHAVSLVFMCITNKLPRDGKFFKKMPKDIIKEHKELWKKIKKLK